MVSQKCAVFIAPPCVYNLYRTGKNKTNCINLTVNFGLNKQNTNHSNAGKILRESVFEPGIVRVYTASQKKTVPTYFLLILCQIGTDFNKNWKRCSGRNPPQNSAQNAHFT